MEDPNRAGLVSSPKEEEQSGMSYDIAAVQGSGAILLSLKFGSGQQHVCNYTTTMGGED